MVSDDTSADATESDGAAEAEASGFEPIEADTWHWQFSDDADVAVDVAAPSFESQESAEEWLTQGFEWLLGQGVAAVTLFDGEGVVYGPMGLAAEEDAT
jgi:hypothetical protein